MPEMLQDKLEEEFKGDLRIIVFKINDFRSPWKTKGDLRKLKCCRIGLEEEFDSELRMILFSINDFGSRLFYDLKVN